MRRYLSGSVFILIILGVLSACGNKEGGALNEETNISENMQEELKPVTLTLYPQVAVTKEDFQVLFAEPVRKKYPHIELMMIDKSGGNTLQNLFTAGTPPDMNLIFQGDLPQLRNMDVLEDMTELIAKHKFNLNRFEPAYIEAIKVNSDTGSEIYGIPYSVNFSALYYNIDIFNKFGVAYPEDGMTWEDAIKLANRLSRIEDNVTYRGLDPESVGRIATLLSPQKTDPATNKSNFNTDKYRKAFEMAYKIYSIPHNGYVPNKGRASFWTQQNIAMLASINVIPFLKEPSEKGLNWDIAQHPSFADNLNVYGQVDGNYIMPLKTSKHKDDIMRVIEAVTSDEAQMVSARQLARLTPLRNPDIKNALGADVPHVQGKRIRSIFKSQPAPYLKQGLYDGKSTNISNQALIDLLDGKDLNSVLRDAEEQHNKNLETEMNK
ncbi:ABC transporter substrate-binding protein [Paenibacillus oceani]|uniref:Extracellular solute-binding protein n=1 Tax=Paenibacillus oceani TaxID=2772510 RepID=A0A927GYT7_9BACL|nr:extracellular solute-binding protein [Paenibacillus oceani]MBD2861528.1 extracellular solute-binding protein [Paenibacillus oceani]